MQDSGIEFDMASLADAEQVLSDDKHFYQLNSKPIAQRFVNIQIYTLYYSYTICAFVCVGCMEVERRLNHVLMWNKLSDERYFVMCVLIRGVKGACHGSLRSRILCSFDSVHFVPKQITTFAMLFTTIQIFSKCSSKLTVYIVVQFKIQVKHVSLIYLHNMYTCVYYRILH